MGQVSTFAQNSIILTSVDRLVASNADGGLAPSASHVILLGQSAGANLNASKVIALGWNAFAGGMSTDADGSTVVGENSFPFLADLTTGKVNGVGAVTVLGSDAFANVTASRRMAGLVAIGASIGASATYVGDGGMDRSVLIGNSIFKNNTLNNALSSSNIMIGHQVASRLTSGATQYIENLCIGDQSGPQVDTAASVTGNIFIGHNVGTGFVGPGGNNTIIGRRAGIGATATSNVVIGANSSVSGAGTTSIVIGADNPQGAVVDGVYIGDGQSQMTGARNILIGRGAGAGETPGNNDVWMVETVDGGSTRRGLMYGDLSKGALLIGLSTPGTNRDLPGTNILKILNGTKTGTPVGGGMFYVSAGALHYVGSAGTDTVLAPA